MAMAEKPQDNDECGDRMDELSNLLADAATSILDSDVDGANALLIEVIEGLVQIREYITEALALSTADDEGESND